MTSGPDRSTDPAAAHAAAPDTAALPPFAGLTPDTVLDALDAVGLRGDGRLIQLNSYENRVFQVFLEDGRVVVAKFYRPARWSDVQILEEHSFTAELAEEECPVVAPWVLTLADDGRLPARLCGVDTATVGGATAPSSTLAEVQTAGGPYRFAVADRRSGRAPELEDPATLEWTGRLIGRMHQVGARSAFAHRRQLSVAEWGTASRDWLLTHDQLPPDQAPVWRQAVDQALDLVQAAFNRAAPMKLLRLHGDCHAGNVLWTAQGPHFVDLDDTLTGPAIQDLWMLLSGEPATARRELNHVLAGYEQFMDFDDRELALIEPLRTLRMLHHSAWLARRWDDPAFQVAFPWFGQPSYWAQCCTELREQTALMLEQNQRPDF